LAATTDTEQQEIGKDGNVQKFLAAATLKGKDVRSLPNRWSITLRWAQNLKHRSISIATLVVQRKGHKLSG